MKWKPISTAPTNNKHPLLLAVFDEEGTLQDLDFDGAWEYWEEGWEMSHLNGWGWVSAKGIEEPTHWAFQDEDPPQGIESTMDYKILESTYIRDLQQEVKEHLQQGWTLCGGVASSGEGNSRRFFQAVSKVSFQE